MHVKTAENFLVGKFKETKKNSRILLLHTEIMERRSPSNIMKGSVSPLPLTTPLGKLKNKSIRLDATLSCSIVILWSKVKSERSMQRLSKRR